MIITNVCLLLEALSIVICLHHLYGEKFRLDIVTVSFLSIDMIVMVAINYFGMPRIQTMVIYPVIILYCGFRFGFQVKEMAVNIIVSIVLVGVLQLAVAFLLCYGLRMHSVIDIDLLIAGSINFIVILVIVPRYEMRKLSIFLQDSERILKIAIGISIIVIICGLILYKKIRLMEAYQAILLFSGIGFVLVLSGRLIKYKIRAKESEAELKIHKLYSKSFQGLIDDIRLRQHEFDNHINAIYSQHLSCSTFEELVESQKKYCKQITKENYFNKLLAQDNSIIRGFLYTKFVEIDRVGIEISYYVVLNEIITEMPIYKIVEILGDLINNAVEALELSKDINKLHVTIVMLKEFYIEVRNESPYIEYDMLGKFFDKNYSNKGTNRGLGLFNVKQICEKYGLEVSPECKEIDGRNWLSFKVWKMD